MSFVLKEHVLPKIIDRLIDITHSLLEERLFVREKMEAELAKLKATRPHIQAVFSAVEGNPIRDRNDNLDSWLWQFRDAAEAAEDVLDELEYYEIEEKVTKDEVRDIFSSLKRKLYDYIFPPTKNGILKRLVDVVKELNDTSSRARDFLDLVNGLSGFNGGNENWDDVNKNKYCRETGSLLTDNWVVGREREKDKIIKWLTTEPAGDKHEIISACTIHGIGGVGKTTLAQLVYDDKKVRETFSLVGWICLSDYSGITDAATIIRKILQGITKQSCDLQNLGTLEMILKDLVASKKLFLVLDDVWRQDTDSKNEWEKVVAPLKFGQRGSKILLTTRMEPVAGMIARVIKGENVCLKLLGLEENDFLKLFHMHAFAGRNPDEHKELQSVSKLIAEKLVGHPLAAKVIGGVLNRNMDPVYWNKLKENVADEDIMAILRLSYHYLPSNLQTCFRYCSLFPQDYIFRSDELVKMWMGSGLIQQSPYQKERPEDIGQKYLDQLVERSFLSMKREKLDSVQFYVMHDLLHELARSVSLGECLRATDDNTSQGIPRTIRHISIETRNHLILKEIHHLENLRSLIITYTGQTFDIQLVPNEVLEGLKSLRLLILTATEKHKFPDAVRNLIHLRYLSFEYRHTTEEDTYRFPQSVYNLYHLEAIKFRGGSLRTPEKGEMEGIGNLINLRCFDIPYSSVPHIGKLSLLQELDFYVKEEAGHKLSELRNLTWLYLLGIYDLENIRCPKDALEAKLNRKGNLSSLHLIWSENHSNDRGIDEQVIDNLEPNFNLSTLGISGYGGARSPVWMTDLSPYYLRSVMIDDCPKLESLPPLGELCRLESLSLSEMPAIKQVDRSFYGNGFGYVFQSLRKLKFCNMPEWEKWLEVENRKVFPHLYELKIINCPKLRGLPPLPPSIGHLHIEHVGLVEYPKIFKVNSNSNGVTSASSLIPSFSLLNLNCTNAMSLDGHMRLQWPKRSNALERLSFKKCENLLHFPVECFRDLPSLKTLTIVECPKLVMRENHLPPNLELLTFGLCGRLEFPLLGLLHTLTSLTSLILNGCVEMDFLPQANVFSTLTALRNLEIRRCKKLESLDGIHGLVALKYLEIFKCDKLVQVSSLQPPLAVDPNQGNGVRSPPKLKTLEELKIDNDLLLLLEPLRSLRTIRILSTYGDSKIVRLPEEWFMQNCDSLQRIEIKNGSHLQSLPPRIANLRCLESLIVCRANLITELPELPQSLTEIDICRCPPELEELYRTETGIDWCKVSHVKIVKVRREQVHYFEDM